MKSALIRLTAALPPEVDMLLTVHDSVLLHVPWRLVEQVRQQIVEVMQSPREWFTVPLRVNVPTGQTWCG